MHSTRGSTTLRASEWRFSEETGAVITIPKEDSSEMAKIRIPTPLRKFTGGAEEVAAEGATVSQIVADMAPKARIGFATADVGEVGFANNIRALGGLPGFTYPDNIQQGFKGERDRRVGRCEATFHVTPKVHHKVKALRKRAT